MIYSDSMQLDDYNMFWGTAIAAMDGTKKNCAWFEMTRWKLFYAITHGILFCRMIRFRYIYVIYKKACTTTTLTLQYYDITIIYLNLLAYIYMIGSAPPWQSPWCVHPSPLRQNYVLATLSLRILNFFKNLSRFFFYYNILLNYTHIGMLFLFLRNFTRAI